MIETISFFAFFLEKNQTNRARGRELVSHFASGSSRVNQVTRVSLGTRNSGEK